MGQLSSSTLVDRFLSLDIERGDEWRFLDQSSCARTLSETAELIRTLSSVLLVQVEDQIELENIVWVSPCTLRIVSKIWTNFKTRVV